MRMTVNSLKKVFVEKSEHGTTLYYWVVAVFKRPNNTYFGVSMGRRDEKSGLTHAFYDDEPAALAKARTYCKKRKWKGRIKVLDRISSLRAQAGMKP